MEKEKIARINELSHKQRSVGLNAEEKREQECLRNEFRAEVRGELTGQLDNVYIKMPDGTIKKAIK